MCLSDPIERISDQIERSPMEDNLANVAASIVNSEPVSVESNDEKWEKYSA